ncbi:alpha-hydroxy acid oxidase [Novosphingobium rosa]|uniref:alpha-hydroxy acid oxidase n=1 Tax=Novosphingobium rosa TaxID=76978 RepID=UPI00082988A6|nr:alpha-hydroxy acid oxidase [Novosphingobium rosa]
MAALDIAALEAQARGRLDPAIYDYVAGGAGEEWTLQANERAYRAYSLAPRVLRGAGVPDLTGGLLGQPMSMPLVIAPTAFHRLAHADGESGTAWAAAKAGIPMILSLAATEAIEAVAVASGVCPWFQLYIQPDLGLTETLIRRAEAAGCPALVVTVDSPVFGRRKRDQVHDFTDLPSGFACENMREAPGAPPRQIAFSPTLSWHDIEWLRARTGLPILLKGIMHPHDARLAIEHGVDGIYVSNHGGRQLDGVAPTLSLLPAIAQEVAGQVPIVFDGGIRRAADIVKALALGADVVAIGRPVIWALAAGGAAGVAALLDALQDDLRHTLTLCGCGSPADLDPSLLLREAWS